MKLWTRIEDIPEEVWQELIQDCRDYSPGSRGWTDEELDAQEMRVTAKLDRIA